LEAKIVAMQPHEGTPAADYVPPDWRAKILHARLHVGDAVLMASDSPPGMQDKMRGISVALVLEDPDEAERIFNAFARRRHGDHAAHRDVLGQEIRHADRPVQHALDDQLRTAE